MLGDEALNDAPTSSSRQDRPRNQRRGKETSRTQDFRKRKGAQFMSQLKTQLDEKLFKDNGGIEKFTTTIQLVPQERAVVMPISTRGIGFVVNEYCRRIAPLIPNTIIPTDVLYRTALAMSSCKMYTAADQQMAFIVSPQIEKPVVSSNWQTVLKTSTTHFSGLTTIVKSLGNVASNDNVFYPRPHPNENLGLTIHNLRAYVERMSNLATPAERRREAFRLNSIPSAEWVVDMMAQQQRVGDRMINVRIVDGIAHALGPDEDPIMIPNPDTIRIGNPEQVIAANYDEMAFMRDVEETRAFFERLGRKHGKYMANIEYAPEGMPSQFVSPEQVRPHLKIESALNGGIIVLHPVQGEIAEWYTIRAVPKSEAVIGAISLFGEIPELDAPSAVRSSTQAVQALSMSWMNAISSMI